MLTLLRKIRKSLIESGSARKYLLYAIGEIALVVIGILIALQINNWNEATKLRNKEISIYKEILSELNQTLSDLENDTEDRKRNLNATIKIRNMLIGQNVSRDSFIHYIPYSYDSETASPKTAAFESLKSLGLNILSNDTLRQKITTLYQLRLPFLVDSYRINEEASFRRKIELLFDSYLKINDKAILSSVSQGQMASDEDLRYLEIDDFESLLKDEEFALMVQKSLLPRSISIWFHERVAVLVQRVMTDIENEMVRLEELI